jgi:predicted dehydrogenase
VDEEATPDTVDWKRFLGSAPEQPFSGERFFRWRKYWDFSNGVASDFFYHRLSPLMYSLGPRFPTRAGGFGGVYFFENRQVPDTYSTTIEYEEFGVQILGSSATQAPNRYHGPVIYGRKGAIAVLRGRVEITAESIYADEFRKKTGQDKVVIETDNLDQQTARTAHMLNFLECVRTRKKPIYDARFGYQVMTAIKLGVDSYRQGRMMAFDPFSERVLDQPPPRSREFEGDGANDPNAPAAYQKRGIG